MKSSPEEPKGFFDGFDFWDWLAIYVVSDFGATGIMTLITTGTFSWLLVIAPAFWWLHLFTVRNQIRDGER